MRLHEKMPGLKEVPPQEPPDALQPYEPSELIKISPKNTKVIKPHQDLKDLPQKLAQATPDERERLLMGVHERFWHCSAADMVRLLQAALVPRAIVEQGAAIPGKCIHCAKYAQKMHRPQLKAHISTHFNETVFHDLFFAWEKVFMLLIDECIRWKTGCQLSDKGPQSIVKALVGMWIRVFGPMQTIISDQEGGLVSNLATRLFDSLNIK